MSVVWNRLKYVLSPQFDIYQNIARVVRNKVADIGFGTGFGTHLLALRAEQVTAFEVDNSAVQFAKQVFPYPNIEFRYGNILDDIKGKYDYVVMIDVIEHIADHERAIEKAARLLKVQGMLICSTPNRLSRYRKSLAHVREYSPRELKDLLKRHLKTVDLRCYDLGKMESDYENPLVAICCNPRYRNNNKKV